MASDLILSESVFVLKADELRYLLKNLPKDMEKERKIFSKSLKRGYMKMPDIKMYPSF